MRAVWPKHWPVTWVGRRAVPGAPLTICDPLRDVERLAEIAGSAEVILSLLGPAPGGTLKQDGDLADHARLALALCDAATGPVLLASSAAVYGSLGESGKLLHESTPVPKDLPPYGAAKYAMETATDARVLRIGNVAGFDAILGAWTPEFTLDTFPDGSTPRRSYIGPCTLALTLAALCKKSSLLPKTLNVAEPGAIEMSALLEAAGRPFAARVAKADAIAHVELDTSALIQLVPQLAEPGDPARMVREVRWIDHTGSKTNR